ncbi:uncharacterized protein LOC124159138 isoform X2 [Ischnura elegans]|uniref:uncharacterized protein LOC124159138 isoform X2 n=1 Tax=Ischnura elegans TaxID=197161 RepID=UPI001ED87C36|nr:uncharacterized protein LOC124159138 isoform X2 [Ischnura elegans]
MPGGGKKAVFPTLALHDHEQVRVAANEQEKAKRFHQSRDLRLGGIPWYPSSNWVPSPERRACNLRLRQLQQQQEEIARGTAGLGVDDNHKRKSSEGGKDSPEKETPKVKNKNPQKTDHSSK